MQVIFTYHARIRQRQRKIKKKEILETLIRPDILSIDENDQYLAFKKYRQRALKIVYAKVKNQIKIITLHWLDAKRLKELKPVIEGEK